MKPAAYVLLALLLLLVGGKIFFTAFRKRVRFMRVRSESLPEGFLEAVCPQAGETGLPLPDREDLRPLSNAGDRFQKIAENSDPNAPDQAVLFIEDGNIVLVSAGVAARIARGDRRLARKVARWTDSIGYAYVVIANFGVFKSRKEG